MNKISSYTYKELADRHCTQMHFVDGILWIDSGNLTTSIHIDNQELSALYRVWSQYKDLLSLPLHKAYRYEKLGSGDEHLLVELQYDEKMMLTLFKRVFISWLLPIEEMPKFLDFIKEELINRIRKAA